LRQWNRDGRYSSSSASLMQIKAFFATRPQSSVWEVSEGGRIMRKMAALSAVTAVLCSAPLSLQLSPGKTLSLSVDKAEARIGRPWTPLSVAGVHRRAVRRAYYAAAATGIAATAYGAYRYYGSPYYSSPAYGPYGYYGTSGYSAYGDYQPAYSTYGAYQPAYGAGLYGYSPAYGSWPYRYGLYRRYW
jgi:hypothetical protein